MSDLAPKAATVTELTPAPRGLGRVWAELRRHPMAWGVVAAFVLAGPLLVRLVFPEASPWIGVVGGVALGFYAATCAVPDKFLG